MLYIILSRNTPTKWFALLSFWNPAADIQQYRGENHSDGCFSLTRTICMAPGVWCFCMFWCSSLRLKREPLRLKQELFLQLLVRVCCIHCPSLVLDGIGVPFNLASNTCAGLPRQVPFILLLEFDVLIPSSLRWEPFLRLLGFSCSLVSVFLA